MPENLNPEHQLEYLKELRRKYEEVLADAQKTGDYSEAEKLKEELEARLSALEALFPKLESTAEPLEVIEKGETTLEIAKEIMGEDYFGTEAAKKAFDINVGIDRIIPYSESELKQAKAIGEMLVFRVVAGLTMEDIKRRSRLSFAEGYLLTDPRLHWNEDYYKNEVPRPGWALVGKDIIKDSISIDYISQTAKLRDHLIQLNSLSEHELNEVTDDKLDKIRKLMQTDLITASQQLSELKINKNHHRTVVEALYDFVIRFKNTSTKERMLELEYDWTSTRKNNGSFAYFGRANSKGAVVDGLGPDRSSDVLGVVSVR